MGRFLMGYCLEDFQDAWERYLQLPVPISEPAPEAEISATSPITIAITETSATQIPANGD